MLDGNKFPIENKTFLNPFKFYNDAGHGWLAVPTPIVEWLGIKSQISSYSYFDNSTVYLEEDCDATLFDNAMKAKGLNYKTESIYHDRSPIRQKRRTR